MRTPDNSSALPQGDFRPEHEGHERSDVAVKWVFVFVLLFFLSGIAIHFLTDWQLLHLKKQASPADQWARSGQKQNRSMPPTNFPRLQISPPLDLKAFLAREGSDLNSYGWINRTAGLVHIPIERAIDLLVEKRLGPGTNGLKTSSSVLQLQQERPLKRQAETGDSK